MNLRAGFPAKGDGRGGPAPLVTVLVPARNEERHLDQCLEAIAAQDYDMDRIEVLVVVGASDDATEERARQAVERLELLHANVLVNPTATTPSNLNMGLVAASGEILCRVDARSVIPPDYVSRCVSVLTSLPRVIVTGGAQVAVPPSDDAAGIGIARALNNRWSMGLSRYRRGAASGPTDTVYLGAFRTADLRAVGGWDERLPTNQDFELNRRLGENGTVWFDAMLSVGYVPRSNVVDLFRQYRRFGKWKVRYWRLTHDRPQGRQVALMAAPVIGAGLLGLGLATASRSARPYLLAGALASGVFIEVAGSGDPATGSVSAHVHGLAAMVAVSSGWLLGMWQEALRGRAPDLPAAARSIQVNPAAA